MASVAAWPAKGLSEFSEATVDPVAGPGAGAIAGVKTGVKAGAANIGGWGGAANACGSVMARF